MHLKHAWRAIMRRPLYLFALVVSLALGIGANTAVFTIVDATIIHPLDLPNPRQLVSIHDRGASALGRLTLEAYRDLSAKSKSLSGVAASASATLSVDRGDGAPREARVVFVSDDYFRVLGVTPARGRFFIRGADDPVAVVADAWLRHRAESLDRPIRIAGIPVEVAGVAPATFRGATTTTPVDIWMPISMIPSFDLRLLSYNGSLATDVPAYAVFGRMRAGQGREGVTADLNSVAGRTDRFEVVPLAEVATTVRDRAMLMQFIRLVWIVVAVTLVLTCVNVGNLLTIRTAERSMEFAVRRALGAGTGQLVGLQLTEFGLLAALGGLAGLGLGWCMLQLLRSFTLPGGLALQDVALRLDLRVVVFAALLAAVTVAIFCWGPILQSSRFSVSEYFRRSSGEGRQVLRGRSFVVAFQVCLSLILCVGASLFLRSVRLGFSTDVGFEPRGVVAMSVYPKLDGRHVDNLAPYLRVLRHMQAAPGVAATAVATHVPLAGTDLSGFFAVGARGPARDRATLLPMEAVSADYFTVLGVPLVEGRMFDDAASRGDDRVTVINQSAASALWPGESAIGKSLGRRGTRVTYRVIGVVRDTKYMTLQDAHVPFAYAPLAQEDFRRPVTFVARGREPRLVLQELQNAVNHLAPELRQSTAPMMRPRLVSSQIAVKLAPQRFAATLLSLFAVIALTIAAAGITGTTAYSVSRRTREIGIRRALGAGRGAILRLITRESLLASAAGMVAGIAGALANTRLAGSLLYGVAATDWVSFGVAIGIMLGVGICAALLPAFRALRMEPGLAIRD